MPLPTFDRIRDNDKSCSYSSPQNIVALSRLLEKGSILFLATFSNLVLTDVFRRTKFCTVYLYSTIIGLNGIGRSIHKWNTLWFPKRIGSWLGIRVNCSFVELFFPRTSEIFRSTCYRKIDLFFRNANSMHREYLQLFLSKLWFLFYLWVFGLVQSVYQIVS